MEQNNFFQCDVCDKILSRKDALEMHKKTHTGIRFKCTECDSEYSREDKLEMHQKTKHRFSKKKILESKGKSLRVESLSSTREIKTLSKKSSSPIIKKKRMECKLCPERFPDKVKLSQHMETHGNGPRYFKCDQCESKFKLMDIYLKHRQTKHVTAGIVVRKKVGTRIKTDKGDDESMEMNANDLFWGEFVIDALYMDKDQLNCRVRNLECFTTGNAFEMKAHREKYHQLLEQRISFEKWRLLLPARFLNLVDEMEADKKEEKDAIDVARIIENAKPNFKVSDEYEKKVLDPIRKDFGEYLVNLKHRYAGR